MRTATLVGVAALLACASCTHGAARTSGGGAVPMNSAPNESVPQSSPTADVPCERSEFVAWIDSGFDTGVEGLFADMRATRRSRLGALLRLTEYAAFDYDYVRASPDGRQLRFASYRFDDVVVISPRGAHRVTRPPNESVVLDSEGRWTGSKTGRDGLSVYTSADGVSFSSSGTLWVDGSASYVVTKSLDTTGRVTLFLHAAKQPRIPAVALGEYEWIEVLKPFGNEVYVGGRTRCTDPPSVWMQRYAVEDDAIRLLDSRFIRCPALWGAVFSFPVDVDAQGRVLFAVDRKAPFVAPRQYYISDSADAAPRPLRIGYRGKVLFLDRQAITAIARRLESEAAERQ